MKSKVVVPGFLCGLIIERSTEKWCNTLVASASIAAARGSLEVKKMSTSISPASTVREKIERLGPIDAIIEQILVNKIKNVVVLTGAGISCASGIPDFRSPGGMYSTLRSELLTATEAQRVAMQRNPTLVVDYDLFRVNQFPYLEVRRPFIIGTAQSQWKPTAAHYFIQILHDKGILRRLYTQNIDGLDLQMQIPREKVINVHGSLLDIQCEFCKASYPTDDFHQELKQKIRNIYDPNDPDAPATSSNILCLKCNRPGVKPATVMYGRNLPDIVWSCITEDFPHNVDLLLVIGTSLTVSPACDLVNRVNQDVPRLLLNKEIVGQMLGLDYSSNSTNSRDAIILENCDIGSLYLAEKLGWLQDMGNYIHKMGPASAQAVAEKLSKP